MNIIVSRYNEDLSWTLEYPFDQFKYIVYNKGINDLFEKKYVTDVIPLPNLGRCDHTYLYHIVTNYTKLPMVIIFLPGSTNIENKKRITIKLLLSILNTRKAHFLGDEKESILQHFHSFSQKEYCCQYPSNRLLNNESSLFPCPQRPFGNWFLQHGFEDVCHFCFYGIFSVDKRDVLQHPVIRYKILLKELSVHSNPEVGHYTERAWASIFGPFRYTIVELLFIPKTLKQKTKTLLFTVHV